jgi:hypothetical protein
MRVTRRACAGVLSFRAGEFVRPSRVVRSGAYRSLVFRCGVRLLMKDMEAHLESCGHRFTVCGDCEASVKAMEVNVSPFPLSSAKTRLRASFWII